MYICMYVKTDSFSNLFRHVCALSLRENSQGDPNFLIGVSERLG